MTAEAQADDPAVARRQRRQKYVAWIERICAEDPGARAALRSGVGRGINKVPRMHRLVAPWLPSGCSPTEERAYYAVAAMIAAQPRNSFTRAAEEDADGGAEPGSAHDADSGQDGKKPSAPSERYGESLGTAFARAVTERSGGEKGMRASAAESRLNMLTRQSIDGVHRHLPSSVRYLRGLGVPVDWAQLLDDLTAWPVHSGRIARRWLQDYYRLCAKAQLEEADQADQEDLA